MIPESVASGEAGATTLNTPPGAKPAALLAKFDEAVIGASRSA